MRTPLPKQSVKVRKQKSWIGCPQCDARRQRVHGHRLGDPGLHVGGQQQFRCMGLEHVDGEDQVARRPRHAVAPLDAVADFDGDFGVILVVLVALRDPGDEVVFFAIGIVVIERLEEEIGSCRRDHAGDKGVEGVVVQHLGQPEDQRPVARDLLHTRLLFAWSSVPPHAKSRAQQSQEHQIRVWFPYCM